MKISQKGLYALQSMMVLCRHYPHGAVKIRDIAQEEQLPEKFLEIILIELKNARLVESIRGARGGYRLRRDPSQIHLSEILRVIDGPIAPFGDVDHLRDLMKSDSRHRTMYKVFLDVRNAAAKILENTTIREIAIEPVPPEAAKFARKQKNNGSVPIAKPEQAESDHERSGAGAFSGR